MRLTDLTKVADLKVICRTSAMQYAAGGSRDVRKIGAELDVAYILMGSVRHRQQLRVHAQMVDAATGTQVWAEAYDRGISDIFAVETELAQAMVAQLHAKLSPGEKAAIEEQADPGSGRLRTLHAGTRSSQHPRLPRARRKDCRLSAYSSRRRSVIRTFCARIAPSSGCIANFTSWAWTIRRRGCGWPKRRCKMPSVFSPRRARPISPRPFCAIASSIMMMLAANSPWLNEPSQ